MTFPLACRYPKISMISFYYFCDQTVINQLPTKNVNFVLYWIYSKGFPNWCVPYESTDQMKTWQIDLHPSPSKSSTNPMLQVAVGMGLRSSAIAAEVISVTDTWAWPHVSVTESVPHLGTSVQSFTLHCSQSLLVRESHHGSPSLKVQIMGRFYQSIR